MTTTVFADIITRHLDAFPHFDADDHARTHQAFALAPRDPIRTHDAFEKYFESPAFEAWEAIRYQPINVPYRRYDGYALSLDELAGGEAVPTQHELLCILARAAEIMDGI